jgi:hypothetical protein
MYGHMVGRCPFGGAEAWHVCSAVGGAPAYRTFGR